jgi:hypothetical protein
MSGTQTLTTLLVEAERATVRLGELLQRENDALRQGRCDEVARLLDEKGALCATCQALLKRIAEAGADSRSAETNGLHTLKQRIGELARLADENAMRLRIAVEANKRVMAEIAAALDAMQPGPGVYGRAGTVDRDRRARAAPPPALSIDRAL